MGKQKVTSHSSDKLHQLKLYKLADEEHQSHNTGDYVSAFCGIIFTLCNYL